MRRSPQPAQRSANQFTIAFGHDAFAEREDKLPVSQAVRPMNLQRKRMGSTQIIGLHGAQDNAIGRHCSSLSVIAQGHLQIASWIQCLQA
jgi:hypothetical protein